MCARVRERSTFPGIYENFPGYRDGNQFSGIIIPGNSVGIGMRCKVHRASGSGRGKPSAIMHIALFACRSIYIYLSNAVLSGNRHFIFQVAKFCSRWYR